MGFPDGPLAGAPLNLPQSGGGSGGNSNILPEFNGGNSNPSLVYNITDGPPASDVLEILGSFPSEIVSATLTDVNATGNVGTAPTITDVSATPSGVEITLDNDAVGDDVWGFLLFDSDGNAYAVPSPLFIIPFSP